MNVRFVPRIAPRAIGLGLLLAVGAAGLAHADAPVPNKGDTAWMLTSSALVLMMSIPGLALFYGGLVRTKNMASVLSQVFAIVAVVGVIWVIYGYSLAFTEGSHELIPFAGGEHPWLGLLEGFQWNNLVGGLDRAFLKGLTPDSTAATFSNGVVVPEYAYMVFQMTFAMITPALIIGSIAERMKFSAVFVFIILWVTFIYFPIAHSVWYWAGPDTIADAAKALLDAPDDAAKAAAQANLDAVNANAGNFFKMGALDFAGGTVVHINAGIAGMVGCLMLGKRIGYPRDIEPPHSVTMSMIGASLLWVGWFGFNAGSNLEATGTTALAFVNTMVATAAATLGWMFMEWMLRGKPSLLGMISGAVAGLVAVTPASGFAGPMGSIVLGFVAGAAVLLHGLLCEAADWLRRCPRCLRRALHWRHHRGDRHRHSRRPLSRRRRPHRLCRQTWLRVAGGLRHEGTSADTTENGYLHFALVGYRFGDPLQIRRSYHRP